MYRTAVVCSYYEAKSVIQTQRRLRQQFNVPWHGAFASSNRILLWLHKSEDTGSLRDSPYGAPRTVHTKTFVAQGNHFSIVHVTQLRYFHKSWT
jgi:hypothetical protein